jgi:hypothetical protein
MKGSSEFIIPGLFAFRFVYTDAKYLLNKFAIAFGLSATILCVLVEPEVVTDEDMISGMLLVFEFLFNVDHKRFGL